jgi:hypothetical protein
MLLNFTIAKFNMKTLFASYFVDVFNILPSFKIIFHILLTCVNAYLKLQNIFLQNKNK